MFKDVNEDVKYPLKIFNNINKNIKYIALETLAFF